MEVLTSHIWIIIAWGVFGFLHSYLAKPAIKNNIKLSKSNYRKLYTLFALLSFLGLFMIGAFTETILLLQQSRASQTFGLIAATFGIIIIKQSFKHVNLQVFLGFGEDQHESLIKNGIYAYIRHPLYSATILFFLGYFFFNPTLVSLIHLLSATAYLLIGITFEETKLKREFGKAYQTYINEVPYKLIPRVY